MINEQHIKVGDRFATVINGTTTEVEVIAIREPFTLANWTSADQGKRVYKVRGTQGLAKISRKYHVRQAHQLRGTGVDE